MYKTASRYLQYRAQYPKKPKAAQPRGKKTSVKKLPKSLRRAFAAKQTISGTVITFNKGGFEVDSHGIHAFCPYSLMYPPALSQSDKAILIGRKLQFMVDKIVPKVVLSRRAAIRKYTLEKVKEAQKTREVLDGRIISVMPYGAFVDLGAVETEGSSDKNNWNSTWTIKHIWDSGD